MEKSIRGIIHVFAFVVSVILVLANSASSATVTTMSQTLIFNSNTGSSSTHELTSANMTLDAFNTALGTLNSVFLKVDYYANIFNSIVQGSSSTIKVTSALTSAPLFQITNGPLPGGDLGGSCGNICVFNVANNPWFLAKSIFLSPFTVTTSSNVFGAASGTVSVKLIFDYTPTPVPLPDSLVLMIFSCVALGALRILGRRRG